MMTASSNSGAAGSRTMAASSSGAGSKMMTVK
jgi:hypothetical protein